MSRFKQARELAGLSINQAAKLLGWLPARIEDIENFDQWSESEINDLAHLYHCGVRYLSGDPLPAPRADHLPDHDPGYTTRRGQDGAPMPQAEFLAYFRNAHGALHRRWTLAVAQPGYDKRDWMILDNALSRFGRLVANQIGLDPTERLL